MTYLFTNCSTISIIRSMNNNHSTERGVTHWSTIVVIILSVLVAVTGSLAIWSYMSYSEQKSDVDSRIALKVSEAEKLQAEKDEEKFAEREKEPNRKFVGPSDYGRVTFDYPKTWSVYESKDASSGGTYQAYFNPIIVPQVSSSQKFALRVTIEDKTIDRVLATYATAVKKGDLKSSEISVAGVAGTRLDGAFSKDLRGSAVLFKIRDKTLTIKTDVETFKPDFDKLIKTVEFNQ